MSGSLCTHFQKLLLCDRKLFLDRLGLCVEYQQHAHSLKLGFVNAFLYLLDVALYNRRNSRLDWMKIQRKLNDVH